MRVMMLLLASFTAQANQCPIPAKVYRDLHERLAGFQGLVSKSAGTCDQHNFAEAITKLGTNYNQFKILKFKLENEYGVDLERKVVVDASGTVVQSIQNRMVITDMERVNQVRDFTENVTNSLVDVINSVRKTDCLSTAEKKSVLSTSATIIQEVTSIAGTFAAPYGMTLAVGGNVVSGVMKGIDSVIQGSKHGYDFVRSEDDRLIFSNYICTYENLRNEMEEASLPFEKFSSFKTLEDRYVEKVQLLTSFETGKKYWDQHYKNQSTLQELAGFEDQYLQIKNRKNNGNVNFYNTCYDYSLLMKSDMSVVSNHTQLSSENYFTGVPQTAQECWSQSDIQSTISVMESKVEIYLQANRTFLSTQLNSILQVGEQERVSRQNINLSNGTFNSLDRVNYADWMMKTIERMEWIKKEKSDAQELIWDGSALLQAEINNYREFLSRHIGENLAPDFIRGLKKLQKKDERSFLKELQSLEKDSVLSQLSGDTIGDKYLSATQAGLSDLQHIKIISRLEGLMAKWMRFKYRRNAVRRYCQYLYSTATFLDKVEHACDIDDGINLNRIARQADGDTVQNTQPEIERFLSYVQSSYQNQKDLITSEYKKLHAVEDYFGVHERLSTFEKYYTDPAALRELAQSSPSYQKRQKLSDLMMITRCFDDLEKYRFSSLELVGKVLHYVQWAKSSKQGYLEAETIRNVRDHIEGALEEMKIGGYKKAAN